MPSMTVWRRYGYPVWMPILFAALFLGFPALIITAIYTGDWRYLLGAGLCWAIVAQR